MMRVALAVAGDLLLASIKQCLQESLAVDTYIARDLAELISKLKSNSLDVVILDDQFDQGTWIGTVIASIKEAAPHAAVIVVGTFADGALIYELFDIGMIGYLYRGDDLRPLFESALRSACVNKPFLSPTASSAYTVAVQSGRSQHWHLDKETKLVLRMLAAGKNINQIANEMKIKPRRVYWLRTKLRNRFGATTNEAVVAAAGVQGYLRHDRVLEA